MADFARPAYDHSYLTQDKRDYHAKEAAFRKQAPLLLPGHASLRRRSASAGATVC